MLDYIILHDYILFGRYRQSVFSPPIAIIAHAVDTNY